ncbi:MULTISPECIES: FAD-dependent thymidylate synthase [unclassified Methylobacterium]|uniref:FAD-dependent thymidylate synthase n=1 Tax=unclassified Methylobacterium TaxID=2615210 RepID=UPI0011C1F080|nr:MULTISPECIES: FAD-dependent thymidylate synthase [unclassified Methylobacterium]QEE37960.1 FAD-dependent thymidylate synthase [Methylobacterium sp. WL1]TXN59800.1 FAD-dependent thymidylate synthase [Methylobacterium sp. WL2]
MSCQTSAKVLARSVGQDAPPLTTFQLRYPLQIHAELMTHRMFSRNARSSRAVPTARMIEEVRTSPFIPRHWGANQKGMQATEECTELVDLADDFMLNEEAWLWARDRAVEAAGAFADAGYHKQVANRLLAPFLHIDTVLTTVDLANWNALRIDPASEPHIRDLAIAMREAVEAYGEPDFVSESGWHLPYITEIQDKAVGVIGYSAEPGEKRVRFARPGERILDAATAIMVSVTRCAQVSYTPFHEAKLTIEQEVARHDALVSARPMHASPAEHQAMPDRRDPDGHWLYPELHGNLEGWMQYRKTLAGERA